MRRHASRAIVALCLAGSPGAAWADGFYFGLSGGASWLADADNEGSGLSAEDTTDRGYVFGGSIVYAWSGGWRAEAEVAHRRNDFDQVTIEADGGLGAQLGLGSLNGATLDIGGDVDSLAAMANVYYDFPTAWAIRPYVGAGLGVARIDAKLDLGPLRLVDESDTVLAWQLKAGLSYPATERISLSIGYRYFETQDAELSETVGGRTFDSEYRSHAVELGLRFSF